MTLAVSFILGFVKRPFGILSVLTDPRVHCFPRQEEDYFRLDTAGRRGGQVQYALAPGS